MSAAVHPVTFDFDRLLAPISPSVPSGEDLRYEGTYDRIREMGREEGDLPQGVWEVEAKKADWAKVSQICIEALTNKSKDLQIAAWLLQTWLNLYGFRGTAAGFQLLTDLLDRFWESIYPQVEDGDLEYRGSPFIWINEKLRAELKLIPFVFPEIPDAKPLTWADWEMACLHASSGSRSRGAETLSQDDFQRALHLTPFHVVTDQFSDLDAALSACIRTQEALDERFGAAAPSLQGILSALKTIHAFLGGFVHQMSGPTLLAMSEAIADQEPELDPEVGVDPAILPHREVGGISSRAEAYHWLAAAAEFLSRTEPHSPTPYLIRRAIHWGNLSLEELLPELVRNQTELNEIGKLLQMETIAGQS